MLERERDPCYIGVSAKIPLRAEVPLPDDCAISVAVRTIRSAAGVFAPGHLGELTRHLPFELADVALEETRKVQRRLRDLPSRVGVYFVLALGLFPEAGYRGVWGSLTAGLAGAGVEGMPDPSEKALRDLRRRVGAAPLRVLFEVLAGPLPGRRRPGSATGGCGPSPSTAAARCGHRTSSGTGAGWAGSGPATGGRPTRR